MAKRAVSRQRKPADIRTTTVTVLQADPRVQDYLDTLLMDVSLKQLSSKDADEQHLETQVTEIQAEENKKTDIAAPEFIVPGLPTFTDTPEPITVMPAIKELSRPAKIEEFEQPGVTFSQDATAQRIKPDWAEQAFACLLFDVHGLSLAAPLHELGGICPLNDNLQTVSGQADWFMGILRWNGRNIRVVDTARFVMPERVKDSSHRSAYQSIIVLSDSNWALAVDAADQSFNLQPTELRWRMNMGKRPWLAGTLLHRLCALLDISILLGMLNASEHWSTDTGNAGRQ